MSFMPPDLFRSVQSDRHTGPSLVQFAALCWRKGKAGSEVLLVTSSSGRWILPKGWPIAGKSPAETVLVEAWEEAGIVDGKVSRKPVGSYVAAKRTAAGDDVPCLHRVHSIKVREIVDDFPEAQRRSRIWVSPETAAGMVDEDGLKDILRAF